MAKGLKKNELECSHCRRISHWAHFVDHGGRNLCILCDYEWLKRQPVKKELRYGH